MTGNVGTLSWVAPEGTIYGLEFQLFSFVFVFLIFSFYFVSVLNPKIKNYTEKVDVYSYSIVLWELVTNENPYEDSDNIRHEVLSGGRPEIPEDCLPIYKKLMQVCWLPAPEMRPSFEKILKYYSHSERGGHGSFDLSEPDVLERRLEFSSDSDSGRLKTGTYKTY